MRMLIPTVLVLLAGCTPLRFVIEATSAEDALTETIVLKDAGARASNKVAMIELRGMIADARRPGLIAPGENPVARFTESLQKAAEDRRVKAVLIRINSPGGTVNATEILYREVRHFREKSGKPVVVSMGDVAASGGYYIACAADVIYAHPSSLTGSIGVIMQTINVSEGLNRIGIRADAITSGPNKAVGSPFEPMSGEHRALLQGIVNEFYGQFRSVVVKHRVALSPENLEMATDGRVLTGTKAKELGLVDELGGLRDAFLAAKELAGLKAARLVKYHRPVSHVGSPYAAAPVSPAQINLLQFNLQGGFFDQPGFYYLWDPTIQW